MLKVFEAYKEIVRADKKPLIVLDEVQEVKNWEKFVRSVHEKDEAKIIVTGSSSKLMSEEFATLLTGRTIEIKLFPLSFAEFLKFNNIEIKEQFEALIKKEELIKLLREYVEFGSFPEVTLESNEKLKKEIARKIYEDSLFKDVAKRYRIRNIVKLETLAKYYLSNISSPITFNRISKFLKLPVKTVELYSKYLETSNLLFFLKRFSFSVKMQENSPRKVYAVDVGLPNTIGFRFLENYGKLMENIVTIELLRKKFYFSPLFEVYYYKANDKEVDFVLKEGLKIKQLIQACYNIEDFNVKERELNALVKASKELKCKNLLVITWDYESVEEFKNKKIKFLPLWKWLLFT
ncbi:MAG: ATP-binding protein [Methanosarcinales archaeon]